MATALTPDGVTIAYTDHGGSGPDLLLAHATGFCGGVWAPIAEALTDNFRVVTFDARGLGDSSSAPYDDDQWEGFASDALAVLVELDLRHPFGAGHSCGGALLVLAELRRPGTFRSIWAYEPIIFPVDTPMTNPSPNGNRLSEGARRRRAVFPSREDARANYASKPPLMWLDPRCLDGYLACGLVDEPDGSARLACAPENEARTYEMGGQHSAYSRLAEVRAPVSLVCGENTDATGPAILPLLAERLQHATVDVWADHGHFGCLADPDRTVTSIRSAFVGS
jgi:pimeloyl-ACP methyl ester carboxylesterase